MKVYPKVPVHGLNKDYEHHTVPNLFMGVTRLYGICINQFYKIWWKFGPISACVCSHTLGPMSRPHAWSTIHLLQPLASCAIRLNRTRSREIYPLFDHHLRRAHLNRGFMLNKTLIISLRIIVYIFWACSKKFRMGLPRFFKIFFLATWRKCILVLLNSKWLLLPQSWGCWMKFKKTKMVRFLEFFS